MPRKRRILEIESIIGCFGGEKSRAQLRALLAVARAALIRKRGDITPAIEHHETRAKSCRLCCALRRLDRVSGGKP